MKMKRIAALLCAALLCMSLAGCGESTVEVLNVNGEKVALGEFTFYLESMKQLIAEESSLDITDEASWQTVEIDNKKAIDVAKEKAIDDVVSVMVQMQKAKEEGIVLTDKDKTEIGKEKNNYIQQLGGKSEFEAQLKKWGISSAAFDKILQNYKYASKLQAKYIEENEAINSIADEEVQAKYDSVKEQAVRSTIFVKHILKMPQEVTDTAAAVTDDEARAQAEAILARLQAGEDFETLMRENSDDVESSYDGYQFTHNSGQYDIDFDNAAYALAVGETSGIVKTQFGYHIIKRYEANVEIPTLDEVRDSVVAQIKSERYQSMVSEKWVAEANVVKQDDVLNGMK